MRRTVQQEVGNAVEVHHPVLRQLKRQGATEAHAFRMGECSVFAALEPKGFHTSPVDRPGMPPFRWHLSIAHPDRYPTWDEIVAARDQCLPHDRAFAQILPGSWDEWVNIHSFCFHLWEVRDEDG